MTILNKENRASNVMSSSSYNCKQTFMSLRKQAIDLGLIDMESNKTSTQPVSQPQNVVDLDMSAGNKNTADIYESISSSNNVLDATSKKRDANEVESAKKKESVSLGGEEEQVANVPETYNNNISGQEILYVTHNE